MTTHLGIVARLVAAQLGERYGITTTTHHRPYGSPVDPCTWCDLTDPEPAVVQLAHTDQPDACLACADTAVDRAIENGADPDRLHADILAIDNPSITSEPDPVVPGMVTVVDADGRWIIIQRRGIETTLDACGREQMRLDLSAPSGIAAARALRDALTAALSAAGAA